MSLSPAVGSFGHITSKSEFGTNCVPVGELTDVISNLDERVKVASRNVHLACKVFAPFVCRYIAASVE